MPELPEVEVTRLSFAQAIAGAQVVDARLGLPLRWPLGCDTQSLRGKQVLQVRRRGKYLLIDLSTGLLLVHLGFTDQPWLVAFTRSQTVRRCRLC
jgi:formamidopyrimidine-DNA glycosylase